MKDNKTLPRMGILAFFMTVVFHFATKMKQEATRP